MPCWCVPVKKSRWTAAVEEVLNALRTSDCGVVGQGVYWITAVDEFGEL